MFTRLMVLGAVLLTIASLTTPVLAQSIHAGKWTGAVYPPDGGSVAVTFDVSGEGDELAITMQDTPFGDIELLDIELSDTTLEFVWVPNGLVLTCKLDHQDDGSYSGSCTDADGIPGQLVMRPPKAG